MTKKYSSKISYELLVFILLIFYLPLIPDLIENEINAETLSILGFLALVYLFVLYLFLGTNYTIDSNELKIKCGPFSYDPINIMDIKEVEKTKSLLSSPAPSFDRIRIKYNNSNSIIISPKNKSEFLNHLKEINPSIKS